MLIRSGEARLVDRSRSMLYSGFNILPRSVLWSAYFNGRSDNTDVIRAFMIDRCGDGLNEAFVARRLICGARLEEVDCTIHFLRLHVAHNSARRPHRDAILR